jgi:hypothetical protein
VIVVTAASAEYRRCLHQYLASLERRGIERAYTHLAYDLGLVPAHRRALERRFPWCVFRDFDAGRWPAHVACSARTYAWKPVIVAQALEETRDVVLWMDSANIATSDLSEIEAVAKRAGTFTLRGQASLADRCDAGVRARLGVPREVWPLPERVTTACAFDAANPHVAALVARWRELCMDRTLLVPEKPSTGRHMWEQAVFGCLLLTAAHEGRLALNADDVDISSPSPTRLMTTRNKVPAALPAFALPAARAYYWLYKRIDQTLIRRRTARRGSGVSRSGAL